MVSSDVSLCAVRLACAQGELIASGPNNDAYIANLDGKQVFIRERTVDHGAYLQTFAGERYVADFFVNSPFVNIPHLQAIVLDDLGLERYAIFEVVHGSAPAWPSEDDLIALANALATIHRERGTRLGDVGGPLYQVAPAAFITTIFRAELSRVARDSPMYSVTGKLPSAFDVSRAFVGEPICLCHGDVHGANFMRDSAGQFWTIDWEAAKYRVAAADFNQLHKGWLDVDAQDALLRAYGAITGRSTADLSLQIALLRLLWHVRMYNFETSVKGVPLRDDTMQTHLSGVRRELAIAARRSAE